MIVLTREEAYLLNNARYFFQYYDSFNVKRQYKIQSGFINRIDRRCVAISLVNKGHLKEHLNLRKGLYYTLGEP